jgi:hypothetical protein
LSEWDSAAFLVQLNAILRGCLQPNPKTPEHLQDSIEIPPEGGLGKSHPASEICNEMNISPATLKRWRDQLHLLAPPDAAKMR